MIKKQIKSVIRDVPDFPKEGILFKDITPILKEPHLCDQIIDYMIDLIGGDKPDVVVGIESRGFLFGMRLAQRLEVPFVPVRKVGKLPADTHKVSYDLEYGSATLEIHKDALKPGSKVLIHDDLLATGGSAAAASQLVEMCGASILSYLFLISLDSLNGRARLEKFSNKLISIVNY